MPTAWGMNVLLGNNNKKSDVKIAEAEKEAEMQKRLEKKTATATGTVIKKTEMVDCAETRKKGNK